MQTPKKEEKSLPLVEEVTWEEVEKYGFIEDAMTEKDVVEGVESVGIGRRESD